MRSAGSFVGCACYLKVFFNKNSIFIKKDAGCFEPPKAFMVVPMAFGGFLCFVVNISRLTGIFFTHKNNKNKPAKSFFTKRVGVFANHAQEVVPRRDCLGVMSGGNAQKGMFGTSHLESKSWKGVCEEFLSWKNAFIHSQQP